MSQDTAPGAGTQRQPRQSLGRGEIPQLDFPVANDSQDAAVRAEAKLTGIPFVSLEGDTLLSGLGVPEFHRLVRRDTGEGLAVPAGRRADDAPLVALEGCEILARADLRDG